jgi:hypothetical protein
MSEAFKVSAKEFERLETLRAMQSGNADIRLKRRMTGERRPERDSALQLKREVWETTKTAAKWYLIACIPMTILVIAGMIWIWSMIGQQVAAFNQQSAQIQAEHPALPMANWNPGR